MYQINGNPILKQLSLFLLVLFLMSSCFPGMKNTHPCQPPEGFSEELLVGTWGAGYYRDPKRSDTLIIREDGKYKQIIQLEVPEYEYESDWQPWRIEYLQNGTIYLHLTGMRLHAFNPNGIEDDVVGAKGLFIDMCNGPSIMPDGKEVYQGFQMPPGEVILIIRSVPDRFIKPPRGFTLSLPPITDTSSWTYELQESQ
jgi:hypothetical protein